MAFPIGNEIGVFQRNFSMGLGYIGQLYVVRALNVVCYDSVSGDVNGLAVGAENTMNVELESRWVIS